MSSGSSLQRSLGLTRATAMVAGTIIGASIFVQPSEITGQVPSVISVFLVWGVAGLLTLFGALVCAELALRERAVRAVLNGSSARAAAARFELAPSTLTRWLRRLEQEGELDPKPRPTRGSVLDEHAEWLAELRASEPSLPLRLVCRDQYRCRSG